MQAKTRKTNRCYMQLKINTHSVIPLNVLQHQCYNAASHFLYIYINKGIIKDWKSKRLYKVVCCNDLGKYYYKMCIYYKIPLQNIYITSCTRCIHLSCVIFMVQVSRVKSYPLTPEWGTSVSGNPVLTYHPCQSVVTLCITIYMYHYIMNSTNWV